MSEEQEAPPPLTGRAKGWVNVKPWKKGQSGNKSGRPKNLARFGDILMREFYKTVPASMGGKTVKRSQGEIIASCHIDENRLVAGAASKRRTITFGVERIELDAAVDATGLVGRDEGRARAKERVDDVAAVGEIEKGGRRLRGAPQHEAAEIQAGVNGVLGLTSVELRFVSRSSTPVGLPLSRLPG